MDEFLATVAVSAILIGAFQFGNGLGYNEGYDKALHNANFYGLDKTTLDWHWQKPKYMRDK